MESLNSSYFGSWNNSTINNEKEYLAVIKMLMDRNKLLTDLLKNEINKNRELSDRNNLLEERLFLTEQKLLKADLKISKLTRENQFNTHKIYERAQGLKEVDVINQVYDNLTKNDRKLLNEEDVDSNNFNRKSNIDYSDYNSSQTNINNFQIKQELLNEDIRIQKDLGSNSFDFRDVVISVKKPEIEDEFVIVEKNKNYEDINSI